MAAVDDKISGCYVVIIRDISRVYIGKSTGVGVAYRSCKSKLNNGIFHNIEFQADFNENIGEIEYLKEYLSENYDNLDAMQKDVRSKYASMGYLEYGYKVRAHKKETYIERLERLYIESSKRVKDLRIDNRKLKNTIRYYTKQEIILNQRRVLGFSEGVGTSILYVLSHNADKDIQKLGITINNTVTRYGSSLKNFKSVEMALSSQHTINLEYFLKRETKEHQYIGASLFKDGTGNTEVRYGLDLFDLAIKIAERECYPYKIL